jgi:hypothetical protein
MNERMRPLQSSLVDALAGEHRLRRQALKERQEVDHWRQRATFAEARGLAELADGARVRADRHVRMASLLVHRAAELRREIESLRADLDDRRWIGRPPPSDPLEARFAELEIERELDELHRARAGPAPPPRSNEPEEA